MKLPTLKNPKFSPKRLFSKKPTSRVSRSDPSSFTSSSSESDTSVKPCDVGTPTSVLPGAVEYSELVQALKLIARDSEAGQLSEEEVASILREVDTVEPAGDEELRETFEVFDTDGDGKITAEELQRVLAAIGDERCTLEDCRRMIAEVDKNGDGVVCLEDFTRLMVLSK